LNAFRTSDAFILSNYGNTEVSKLAVGWIEASYRFIEQFGELQNCLLPSRGTFIARLAQAYGSGIGETARVPALPALRLWQCAVNPIHERFLRRYLPG
jgi:hypothetical protein